MEGSAEKKRILLVLDNIHTGGISKSLLNYLPNIAGKADCDLLIFNYWRLNTEQLPKNINVLVPDRKLSILGMSQAEIKAFSPAKYIIRAALVLLSRVFGGNFARGLLFRFIPKLKGYDLAISYSQDVGWNTISTGCNHFVLDRVEAKRKAAFIHCDYQHFGGYDKRQEAVYGQFDKIACVSESCAKSFLEMFPSLQKKSIVCENFTNVDEIRTGIQDGCYQYDSDVTNLVSVCRISEEKGLDRAADAMGKLYREGHRDFHWLIVGDGPERKKLEDRIASHGLTDVVTLVGRKDNPYYYVKGADFFLLPSYHEAAPMVFGECQALGVPILTTATISAKELVQDRGLGVACDNSEEGIYQALKDIFTGQVKMERLDDSTIARLNQNAQQQLEDFLQAVFE